MNTTKFKAIKKSDPNPKQITIFTLEDLMRGKITFANPEHYHFCQHTGMSDMHGNGIYRGDILRYAVPKTSPKQKQRYHYWEVVWYEKKGCWRVMRDGYTEGLFSKVETMNHEIVGDIYQDANLLKTK